MTNKRILIVAGEPSGDLHASNLVKDIKKLSPGIEFFGLGGALSKDAGVSIDFDIARLAIVGLVEVFKNIFTVGKVYKGLLHKIDSGKVDLAILVDYPGFNLRLAGELEKRSIPVVYYISPQIWAWGKDRINIIKRCVKKMIVFFKFEEELYKTYGVDVEFVGHPLIETVKASRPKNETLKKYGLSGSNMTISVLPGSRITEIKRLLPIMAGACKEIREKIGGIQFIIAKYPGLPMELYKDALKIPEIEFKFAEDDMYNVLSASDFAIVASGTATLESAIIGTPFALVYKVSLGTYIAYNIVSTTRFIGIVNVIAGKEIIPELLQYKATSANVAGAVISRLTDSRKLADIRERFNSVKDSLGSPGASERAAKTVIKLLG